MQLFYRTAVTALLSAMLLGISTAYGGDYAVARALLACSLFVYLNILASAVVGRGERTYALSATLFFVNLLVLPAMMQCSRGYFPFFSKSYPTELVNRAAFTLLLFSIALGVAHARSVRPASPALTGPKFEVQPARAVQLMVLLSAIALIGFAVHPSVYTTKRSDITDLVFNPTPMTVLTTGIVHYSGYYAFLVNACAFARSRRFVFLALIPVTLAIAIIVNNPLNVARFSLLALVICTLFVLLRTDRMRFKVIFAVAYTVGLVTLFPFLSQIARGARGSSLFTNVSEYYGTSGDFDGFQSLINVVNWVDQDGMRRGKQLMSALLVFIPREWWPSKGAGTGGVAAAYAGYPFTNISAPLPSEFYADFGLIGVVIGGAFVGWLMAHLDRTTERAQGHLGRLAALGAGAGFAAILLRGSLIGVIGPSGLGIAMGLMLAAVDRRPVLRLPRLSSAGFPSRSPRQL